MEREFLDQVLIHDGKEAPEFLLLDVRGPSPGALLASVASLSILLLAAVLVSDHRSAAPLPAAGALTSIDIAGPAISLPMWVRAGRRVNTRHPFKTSESRRTPWASRFRAVRGAPRTSRPPEPARSPTWAAPSTMLSTHSLASLSKPSNLAAVAPPARSKIPASPPQQKPRPTVAPLPMAGTPSHALSLVDFPAKPLLPADARPALSAIRDVPKPVADTLGTLPLPTLLRREAALAASLEALPRGERLALPRVSIRVDATWIEALPQTHERLYFSVTVPQADTRVLAYSAESRNFGVEPALRPLWQIRDVERVPALVFLRQAAARRLGVPRALVSLYTWHPPLFENALRMFVLERMQQLGIALQAADVVVVRLLSGPTGYVMRLDPVRAASVPPRKQVSDTLPD
jgi:hypothetical protein